MTCIDIIKKSADAGVFLYVEDEKLKYKISCETFPSDIKALILANKPALIEFLSLNSSLDKEEGKENVDESDRLRINNWSHGEKISISDKAVHEIFEQKVAQCPNKIALSDGEKSLTFLEVNKRVNQLAHYLSEGCLPNARVGFLFPRSIDAMVAIFAALKAGIVYVPIDMASPNRKILAMLDDAEVDTLLCHSSLASNVDDYQGRVICLDDKRICEQLKQYSDENISTPQVLTSPAYIIYTSGSTGRANGVVNTRANMANFHSVFEQQFDALGLTSSSAWLWNASYAFDASLKGVMALALGCTVVVPDDQQVKEPEALVKLIKQHGVDVFNAPPILMEYVISELDKQALGIHLIVSGDDVSTSLWNSLLGYGEKYNKKAINAYGPTEATVNASFGLVEQRDIVTLGNAAANTQIYVLDEHLKFSPVGAIGEIYIGGAGLAEGYLNRKTLTEERFIGCPWEPNKKLFKSGDLARYREDGRLQFIERSDQQLKFRGFRIELGEVESAIAKITEVQDVAVLTNSKEGIDKKLVAYVVTEASLNKKDIQQSLATILPDYMIPSEILFLETLPQTHAGKRDVSALKALFEQHVSAQSIHTLDEQEHPDSNGEGSVQELESKLRRIWCTVLGVDAVASEDDFYSLGGYSVLALKLLEEINCEFGVDFSVGDLFRNLTFISQLNLITDNIIENAQTTDKPVSAVEDRKEHRESLREIEKSLNKNNGIEELVI